MYGIRSLTILSKLVILVTTHNTMDELIAMDSISIPRAHGTNEIRVRSRSATGSLASYDISFQLNSRCRK